MSLVLTVDGERWRRHLLSTVASHPGIVPVAKGNGYGFTNGRLARRCQWLDEHHAETGSRIDTMAVGTYPELDDVARRYDGDLLVLTPWRPQAAALGVDDAVQRRVVHTVSRLQDLPDLLEREPDARFVLEQLTTMRRHGMTRDELARAAEMLSARADGARGRSAGLEGVAIHLPLNTGSHIDEVTQLIGDMGAAGLDTRTLYVSHLSDTELGRLRGEHPDLTIRPRIGTGLWLGDRGALRVTATVLDVHEVRRGDLFGYRHRRAPRHGHLLVVSGGTAHGLGLEAPTGDLSMRARAATVARGGLDAVGLVRSPFSVDGKQRVFAEPPHMQASMLFLPAGARVPAVGDEVDVRVRYTATDVDEVRFT